MREHMGLYRAKRIYNGEWVMGNLMTWADGETQICCGGIDALIKDKYEVDPDTVGECCGGLRDKNGKLIFEGDIVKATIVRDLGGGEENRTEQGVFGYDIIGMLGLISYFDEGVPVWSEFFHELSFSSLISDYYFEIVGNIHDNPELLKGGEGDD